MYYVYILTNQNNTTLYIGVTNNIARRITEHKNNVVYGFSAKYNLHKLVYVEQFNDVYSAISREKQLKGWKRIKKDNLINQINPQWRDLANDI